MLYDQQARKVIAELQVRVGLREWVVGGWMVDGWMVGFGWVIGLYFRP